MYLAVLAHERMHVQRADCLVALIAEINCCLYWFHPLAWWLKRHLFRHTTTSTPSSRPATAQSPRLRTS